MGNFERYVVLILTWFLVRALFTKYRRPSLRLPPGPMALPIIGHLHLLGSKPHQSLQKLSNRYGSLIQLFLGSVPCVVVSSPEMAKDFLQVNDVSFSNRPKKINADYLTYGSADLAFASYGPHWRFMKKLCMTQLLGMQTLNQFAPIRQEERNQFLRIIFRKAKAGETVDVKGELMRLTNNLITRISMSKRCSENEDDAGEVRMFLQETVQLSRKFNLADFIWFCKNLDLQGFGKRVKEARDRFDKIMERIMKEHEEARKEEGMSGGGDVVKDLLHILLDIVEDENAEMRLTKENVKAIILDIFGAGTETSTTTMEWALAELINHPNIMEKARQEINTTIGKGRLVEENDIANLPYLQAIVKETLRLHPAGPLIGRESSKDCTIGGYEIRTKTHLLVNVWAIGRDPKYWENPLEFWPERFLNEDGSNKRHLDVRGQNFQLLPFGSGRRICPGASLALQVVQTSLAAMIQCFDWKVGDGGRGIIDMEEGLGSARARPLVCVPVARFNPFSTNNQ